MQNLKYYLKNHKYKIITRHGPITHVTYKRKKAEVFVPPKKIVEKRCILPTPAFFGQPKTLN